MTTLEKLAHSGHAGAIRVMDAFDPDQPRDEKGMWSGEGGGALAGGGSGSGTGTGASEVSPERASVQKAINEAKANAKFLSPAAQAHIVKSAKAWQEAEKRSIGAGERGRADLRVATAEFHRQVEFARGLYGKVPGPARAAGTINGENGETFARYTNWER